ncbi:RHS repeat domain-containing protein [Solilutibacter pythonis]|uniref:RHS repeat domain-containing protein n=1 Tax=Solilutibacter pythonis TaxID=2483112 RepID=UPI00319DB0A0
MSKQQVIWLENYPIAVIDGSGAAANIGYIEPDHLGTPRVIIDAKRNVATWRWPLTGEAFGADAPEEDPDGDGERYEFDLCFPGQRYDRHTGLHYNYFRDYEPQTGRYVQSDPIGLKGGVNTYAYVEGDPLMWFDSKGLCRCMPLKANGHYQGTGNHAEVNVWGGIRTKHTVTCTYACSNGKGNISYIRATHIEMRWGDKSLDDGREGVCLGTTFGKPEFNYSLNRALYAPESAYPFDPREGPYKAPALERWAKQYCEICK